MSRIPKIIDFNTQNEADNFFEEAPEGYYLYRVKSKAMFSRVSMVYHKPIEPFNITIASNANITVNNGSSGNNHLIHAAFEYSYDKTTWKGIANNTRTQFEAGKIYFRNTKDDDTSWDVQLAMPGSGYKSLFTVDTKYTISGHICSLMGKTGYKTMTPKSCQNLFYGDISLSLIDDLILPSVGSTGSISTVYLGMFTKCTGLSKVKMDISHLITNNIQYMFYQCTSLTDASELQMPNSTPFCSYMFYGCSSLVNAPALPATSLNSYSYDYMFYGCSSLVNAPALPATTLYRSCYYSMFEECTSLVNAPALPAPTLVSNCYRNMFSECPNVNEITCYASDISASKCLQNWLDGASSTGTFHNLGGATYPRSASGIPSGWTEVFN